MNLNFLKTFVDLYNKKTINDIEQLIFNEDLDWIIQYCKDNIVVWRWTNQWMASYLYNMWNSVWQRYNNHNLAIWLYKESIKYIDTDATVYNNLATEYKRLKNFDTAIKYYNLALKYDSNNPIRYLRPAWLYAYIWSDDEAIKYLKKYFEKWWDDINFISLCKTTFEWWEDLLKLYNLI